MAMRRSIGLPPLFFIAGGATIGLGLLFSRLASASTRPLTREEAGRPGETLEETEPVVLDRPLPISPGPSPRPDFPNELDPLDIEAAARMIASENPRGSRQLHIEQVWTQIRSQKPGQSLYQRITAGSGWGAQGRKAEQGKVRPVSTAEAASRAQLDLVEQILQGKEKSVMPGAKKFFEPAEQDTLFAMAEKARAKKARGEELSARDMRILGYHKNAEQKREDWRKDGRPVGTIDGVEFWT